MKDDEIFDYVIKENWILVTNYMRCSLKTALANHLFRFYDKEPNKTYQINAKETQDAMKFSDSATFYLLENDEVIIP
ncbi:MAG: hypothetical protein IH841_01635 [Thaumarchaeota archaeon]|nr:hypothetical protein [Nitrososphaerota archaeon]